MDCPGIERGSFVMEEQLRTCGQMGRNWRKDAARCFDAKFVGMKNENLRD